MRSKWPKQGETRIKKGFLWLPLTINKEQRWLERAMWSERVDYYGPPGTSAVTFWRWNAVEWLDEDGERTTQ